MYYKRSISIECLCRRNCFKLIITVSIMFYFISFRYIQSKKNLFEISFVGNSDVHSIITTKEGTKNNIKYYKPFKETNQKTIPKRFQHNLNESHTYPYDHIYDVPDAATYPLKFYFSPDETFCSGEVLLLITVKSSINHFIQRDVIRNTWGRYSTEEKVQVVFLLGVAKNNPDLMIKVSEESEIFNDILVGSYEDTYKNLTLKTLSGFNWLNFHCNNAKNFMSVDDDVILNVVSIVKYYDDLKNPYKTIHCGTGTALNARVTYRGKWAVPFEKYPNIRYPPYCLGPCYLMSTESAIEIFRISRRTHCDISVDDAMITGVLREKVDFKLGSMPNTFCEHLTNSKNIKSKLYEAWKKI